MSFDESFEHGKVGAVGEVELKRYSRVWRDRRRHHQDMILFPEEPPHASVVSSYIQVPNMEALNRGQNVLYHPVPYED